MAVTKGNGPGRHEPLLQRRKLCNAAVGVSPVYRQAELLGDTHSAES